MKDQSPFFERVARWLLKIQSPSAVLEDLMIGKEMLRGIRESTSKPRAVIFDVDGTLCDVSAIRHLVSGDGIRDFHAFHEASVSCPPHPHVLEAAKDAYASGLRVIVVTARKERYKAHTSWWLAINGVPSHALKMRANYDTRPDHEVKRDILIELRESYEIAHVWDDNPSVVEMWRAEGIPVTVVPGW